jgi:hypothetical protein
VEQVFGDFSDFRLYDTSIIKNNDKVYYFKRLFTDKEPNAEGEEEEEVSDYITESTL